MIKKMTLSNKICRLKDATSRPKFNVNVQLMFINCEKVQAKILFISRQRNSQEDLDDMERELNSLKENNVLNWAEDLG